MIICLLWYSYKGILKKKKYQNVQVQYYWNMYHLIFYVKTFKTVSHQILQYVSHSDAPELSSAWLSSHSAWVGGLPARLSSCIFWPSLDYINVANLCWTWLLIKWIQSFEQNASYKKVFANHYSPLTLKFAKKLPSFLQFSKNWVKNS